jgi:hypothetical protein
MALGAKASLLMPFRHSADQFPVKIHQTVEDNSKNSRRLELRSFQF